MTKQEMQAMIDAAMNSGSAPSVKVIAEGDRALAGGQFIRGGVVVDPRISNCNCGCLGNRTDHTMRAGESGRLSSW